MDSAPPEGTTATRNKNPLGTLIAMVTNFLLQTSGKMWRATFLGACRLGLVLGPVVMVLPPLLGKLGVQIAQPTTDILTTLIALPMARAMLREMRTLERKTSEEPLYDSHHR